MTSQQAVVQQQLVSHLRIMRISLQIAQLIQVQQQALMALLLFQQVQEII
jgi:hypothetical protein